MFDRSMLHGVNVSALVPIARVRPRWYDLQAASRQDAREAAEGTHMAESLNKEKARRAASHPDRPGEQCRAAPGVFRPVVDRNRCEAKGDCVEVCPYQVFEVARIESAHFEALSLRGKLKSLVHGRKTAYTPNAERCQACGLCVVACPEKAIKLAMGPIAG